MSNHSSITTKIEFAHGVLTGMSVRAAARRAGICGHTGASLLTSLGLRCGEMLAQLPRVASGQHVQRAGKYYAALAIEQRSLLIVAVGVSGSAEAAVAEAGVTGTVPVAVPLIEIRRNQARSADFVRHVVSLWAWYWNLCHVPGGIPGQITVEVPTDAIDGLRQRAREGETLEAVAERVLRDVLGLSPRDGGDPGGTPAMRSGIAQRPKTLHQVVAEMFGTAAPETILPRSVREIAAAADCAQGTVRSDMRRGMTVDEIVITRKTLKHASLGTEYGRLTVRAIDKSCQPDVMAIVDCACGTRRKAVALKHVLSGRVTSCGCLHLEVLSRGEAPTHVEVFGHSVPVGVLADIAGIKPVSLWSRIRRGLTPEEAAFGRVP